ncbi:SCF E3 ubiquitin ligase complex F-box protein grrA-like [Vicia villosa]|uniref:SCF E3 ubiquitin ligase complex F-box protein grrA-like n=1 Tax=Vicia villosa TaxID=3911 RepID=UPI00273BD3E0|nr:SCF E3 ubiquitin ligase complex F-box protein grrA-like [Vicia villosa]
MKTCLKSEAEFYLSDDCWEHVFTFLINCRDGNTQDNNKFHFKSLSLVSKQFLSITNTLLLSLTISHLLLSLPTPLLLRFSNLNSLDLSFNVRLIPITSHFIHSLLTLKALTSLSLSRWPISDNFLYAVGREALPLKRFVLQNCTGYTYHGIYSFLSKCQTIRHFGLLQDHFINDHHIASLSFILPRLVSINVSRCWKLTESALFALISNCRSLSEITMECINFQNSHSLKDFDVIPQLKSLSLAYSWLINDEAIVLIASVLPNLQHLDLSYCYCISENGVIKVIERCKELKKIDLRYCKEVDADAVVSRVLSRPSLQKRKLFSSCGIIDEYFLNNDHVAELSLLLPHLVSIDLSRCSKLTESALLSLIRNCHSLEEITMKHIYFGNFDSFNDFHVNYQLKSLCLAGNKLIKNENIIMFVSIFPNLQLLDLSRCRGMRLLEMNFVVPELEVLNLSYTRVDDKTLYEISKSCHGLLQLLLTCCDHVTQEGIISVVENCTQLKEIDLRYCNKVKADVVVSKVLSRSSLKKRKLFSRNGRIFFY